MNTSQPSTAEECYTLLKTAVQHGNPDSVKFVLFHWRADVSMADPSPDQTNYLVPQAAAGNDHPEALNYLLSELRGIISIHAITLARSPAIFGVFSAHRWEADDSMLRSKVCYPEFIALFLSCGADAKLRRFSPPDIAALHGPLETVKLLVGHGAKIGADCATLHVAAKGDAPDRIPVMEFRITEGADIDGLAADLLGPSETRGSGRKGTPLHSAAKWANDEAKPWLLEYGVDPEARNELGETPDKWGRRFDDDGPERGVRLRRAILQRRTDGPSFPRRWHQSLMAKTHFLLETTARALCRSYNYLESA
ncbi:MAG: hypothetical protein Q9184_007035 [Pyrenodesmia sp. 2 TL-2023]